MTVKNKHQIQNLSKIGRIVADTIQLMKESAKPGMNTFELDQIAGRYLKKQGAISAPQSTYRFPGFTCISLNDIVAHGIPRKSDVIQSGDLINVDVSASVDGFFADSGHSFVMPLNPNDKKHDNQAMHDQKRKLCLFTENLLEEVIAVISDGVRIQDIGALIESRSQKNGYQVIKNLASHGTGGALHEQPENILNYRDKSDKRIFKSGMVITIEPFVCSGNDNYVETLADGWSLQTQNKNLVAQHEHTMIVTEQKPIVLTRRPAA